MPRSAQKPRSATVYAKRDGKSVEYQFDDLTLTVVLYDDEAHLGQLLAKAAPVGVQQK